MSQQTLVKASYSPCPYPGIHHEPNLQGKKFPSEVNMLSNDIKFEMQCLESKNENSRLKRTSNAIYTKLELILPCFS